MNNMSINQLYDHINKKIMISIFEKIVFTIALSILLPTIIFLIIYIIMRLKYGHF